jgi:hypothetical protein
MRGPLIVQGLDYISNCAPRGGLTCINRPATGRQDPIVEGLDDKVLLHGLAFHVTPYRQGPRRQAHVVRVLADSVLFLQFSKWVYYL